MVEPDVWIPRLTNGEEGLLEQASDFPKHVNPNDVEDLDDLFMYENQLHGWSQAPSSSVVIEELPDSPKRKLEVNNAAKGRYKVCAKRKALPGVKIVDPRDEVPTQASRTPVVMDKSKGKRKMEMEEQTGDSDSEEDDSEDGSYEKGTDDEDGESNDDDYDPAKNDDDVAVYGIDDDYLFDWLTEAEGNDKGPEASIFPAIEEGSECDEDDEAMFGAVDSDEEAIGEEYDSDGKVKYPEFNPKVDMQNPRFCKGMLFATLQILREAITERAIQKGWEPYYEKSDKSRVRVFCKAMDCEFELFASQKENSNTFQIKTYKGSHNCARVQENCAVKVPYLVRKFSDMIKMNPNIATEVLKNQMSSAIKSKVSFQQAYRTKVKALNQLERSMKEQYAKLQDYAQELRRVDPNTTVDIKCDFNNIERQPVFKRMYICLGALKEGFKNGCRPILGLDGCHLKSAFGGQLLCAVGLDANNTTYVVAYAMVEMENKDSWIWFLCLLQKDLKITGEGNGFTFISDKQKGLLPACEYVLPLAEHRFCVRHLWTNFNKKFPGKALKDQLWAIAKSTTMAYYWKDMTLLNQMDTDAYDWITDPNEPTRSPKYWCRSHFNGILKCDVLLNNSCESFNAFINPARSKPVISCFEEIRVKLMKRIAIRKEKMSKVVDTICPKPREILEKNKVKASTDCFPNATGSNKIEVDSIGGSKYVVDLQRRTCGCRRWNLTGIPCKHAVSAIYFMREKPEDYMDACYLKKTYLATYSHTIQPVNGMDLWMPSDEPVILPPQYNRQPGRPKKNRNKEAAERENDGPKLGRVQKSLKCSNRHRWGHNKKTCHRHLPPKTPVTNAQKRKLNTGEASSSKAKGTKPPPKSKNDLRMKAALKAKNMKEKRAKEKAAARAATSKGRPPIASSTSAQGSQASSRASVRLRAKNSGK